MENQTVYELDVDGLAATLRDILLQRGFDVVEQVPAGIWWLKSGHGPDAMQREVETALAEGLRRCLRPVED